MIVRIGDHIFDDVLFDRERDVLYMHKGKPIPAAETIATREGHAVMLDESGEIIDINDHQRPLPGRARRADHDHGSGDGLHTRLARDLSERPCARLAA